MVMSGSVREFTSALFSLSLVTCAAIAVITGSGCTKKEPPTPTPPAAPPAAAVAPAAAAVEATTATRAGADERPEPGTIPCKYCDVDVARRVGGTWQEAKCQPEGGALVAWPAGSAEVEVLEGNQKGLTFPVTSDPSAFAVGAELSGTLSADAKPDTWSAAQLWITDANGKRCSSTLAIRR